MAVSLRERGRRKPQRRGPRLSIAIGQRISQAPQREGGGEDVAMGQRALREPDGIERGKKHGPERHRSRPVQAQDQLPNAQQSQRSHDQHRFPRHLGQIARGFPP